MPTLSQPPVTGCRHEPTPQRQIHARLFELITESFTEVLAVKHVARAGWAVRTGV